MQGIEGLGQRTIRPMEGKVATLKRRFWAKVLSVGFCP